MSMKNVSLSEQLEDHIAANEEYKLMKQVDKEAQLAAFDDAIKIAKRIRTELFKPALDSANQNAQHTGAWKVVKALEQARATISSGV